MNYKDFGITKQERDEEARDVQMLRPYILNIKEKELGSLNCEICGSDNNIEIHHKRYGSDITIKDLELLCFNCHKLTQKS